MPNKSTINFSTILKRSTCLNSSVNLNENSSNYLDKIYDTLLDSIGNSKDGKDYTIQNNINSFIEAMSNRDSATNQYWKPLKVLSELNLKEFNNVASMFNHQYVTRILPYTEDLSLISDDIDRFNITNEQAAYINENINKFKISDRILGNYNSLSKRFNLENAVIKFEACGLKAFVNLIAEMVDTYNTKNYQKLNITLEEVDYILSKEGKKYDKGNMAKFAANYYLSQSSYLSESDIDNFKRTFRENYILNESDIESVSFLLNGVDNTDSIDNAINNFLLYRQKTPQNLYESISSVVRNTSSDDIVYNSNKITELLWELTKNEIFDSDDSLIEMNTIIPSYIYESDFNTFTKEDISLLIKSYNKSLNDIRISGNSNPDYAKASVKFIENGLEPCIEAFKDMRDILYDKSNLLAIKYLSKDHYDAVTLESFKIFKFHNLIRAAFNLNKFLKVKERKLIDNGKNKVSKFMKKAKNVLFGESTNEQDILNYIGEDGKVELVVRQYIFENDFDDNFVSFIKEVCSEYNDVLISQYETFRCYYIINPGIAEIRIGDSTTVDVSDLDVYSSFNESLNTYLDILEEADCELDLENFKLRTLYDNIEMMNKSKEFTFEQFKLALEALSIIGVEKADVEIFANEFTEYNFNNAILKGNINESYNNLSELEDKISLSIENWEIEENTELQDKIEAYNYLQAIFEYSFPDSSDDEDDDEDEDDEEEVDEKENKKETKKPSEIVSDKEKEIPKLEPPKGKLYKAQMNLNSIKLGLEGLKAKFKDLSTKEKEISRNMDSAARSFATASKNALTSNRRESIIKGSVIPSFSRCMKASILLAGVAHFSLPAAVIGAMGALAISKKLTKTERLLLLDEIETELDVVEKELQLADSNNQINKYRELLKYKKNLQRQYQRIRYNVRVGKDILPGSAVGVPNGE